MGERGAAALGGDQGLRRRSDAVGILENGPGNGANGSVIDFGALGTPREPGNRIYEKGSV